jgi:hypothetical protein
MNFDDMFATRKLKKVSLTEIQNAISEALLKVVGETDTTHKLEVSIDSLEFDNFSRAKMTLRLDSNCDPFETKGAVASTAERN